MEHLSISSSWAQALHRACHCLLDWGASFCIRCGTEGEGRMEVQALPQRAVGLRRAPDPVAMPLLYEVQCCGSVSSQQSVSQFIFL